MYDTVGQTLSNISDVKGPMVEMALVQALCVDCVIHHHCTEDLGNCHNVITH